VSRLIPVEVAAQGPGGVVLLTVRGEEDLPEVVPGAEADPGVGEDDDGGVPARTRRA
jgi:hypothetical protein